MLSSSLMYVVSCFFFSHFSFLPLTLLYSLLSFIQFPKNSTKLFKRQLWCAAPPGSNDRHNWHRLISIYPLYLSTLTQSNKVNEESCVFQIQLLHIIWPYGTWVMIPLTNDLLVQNFMNTSLLRNNGHIYFTLVLRSEHNEVHTPGYFLPSEVPSCELCINVKTSSLRDKKMFPVTNWLNCR